LNDYHQLIHDSVVAHSVKLRRPIDYVEVGVFTGNSADAVLSTCRVRHAALIDNWSLQSTRTSKEQVDKRLEKFAPYYAILEGDSRRILPELLPNSFDIGFVDGDHSAESCQSDMKKMLPLLRHDGIMFVHDLTNPDYGRHIKPLVEAFALANNLSLTIHSNVENSLGELTRN
jgi:predicted O-methyltransferase YrrM